MTILLSSIGITFAALTLIAIVWSIVFPSKRFWPPQRYTKLTPIMIWVPTFSIFGCLIGLGILGWGEISISDGFRFGVGIPLILLANLAVWYEVLQFGVDQTGGAKGSLRIQGLYRYSRNPQYVADIAMIIGWLILSASAIAVPLAILGIMVLAVAPFAEEPWMSETYGDAYDEYRNKVRRYL